MIFNFNIIYSVNLSKTFLYSFFMFTDDLVYNDHLLTCIALIYVFVSLMSQIIIHLIVGVMTCFDLGFHSPEDSAF